MKIILSRKGFDSGLGKIPSPILPDGTLLSLPIPQQGDKDLYKDLSYDGINFEDLILQLNPQFSHKSCHLDPDLRPDIRSKSISDWRPAFGQACSAQGYLNSVGVEKGDIFLFFGIFHLIEKSDGRFSYVKKADDFYKCNDIHVIYAYMQIGDIINNKENISKYYWHPHSKYVDKNNTIYIPSDSFSLNPMKKGYGCLDFRYDRVLTMKNKSKSIWNDFPFLLPDHVYGNRKNSASHEGLYYRGQWQEIAFYESKELLDWVRKIID